MILAIQSGESLILFVFHISTAQEKVILDTDPSYDPDDVGCMAMLHNLASLGECQILGIVNSTNHKDSPLCIASINQFFNRNAIPVGTYMGYSEKIDAPSNTYDYYIAKEYPRALEKWDDVNDAVAMYREILASAADKSITIVVIGTMHNFYGLLKSGACEYSGLSGKELVHKKVKLVATMGGNFIDGKGLDRTNWGGADKLCEYTSWSCLNKERNEMCRFVIENNPAPFMASGWEVGCGDYYNANFGNVMTGQGLKKLDKDNIVRRSYEYHFEHRGGDENISRHSNDQCALHYAIRGESVNYVAKTDGKITLSKTGECSWEQTENGVQGYIQKKRDKNLIADEIESLMMGNVMDEDKTPPSKPGKIKVCDCDGQTILCWKPSKEKDKGSWVVGYNIYKNGQLVKMAYGNMYPLKSEFGKYEVRAVNASGYESKGSVVIL